MCRFWNWRVWVVVIAAVGWLVGNIAGVNAALTTNNWTTTDDGKWEIGANWDHGVPALSDAIDTIHNNNTFSSGRTVTIDAATVLSNALNSCLSISNLTLATANMFKPLTLLLTNAALNKPLTILGILTINTFTSVVVSNAALKMDGSSTGLGFVFDDGTVTLGSGTINAEPGAFIVGEDASGGMTMLGGTLEAGVLYVGREPGSHGAMTVSGGQLLVTNSDDGVTYVGFGGTGQMTITNAMWLAKEIDVGYSNNSQGTLTAAGGTTVVSGLFSAGYIIRSTGVVWQTGGQLTVTNGETDIGYEGMGQITVSNGTWRALDVHVGIEHTSQGTLTIAGGTNSLSDGLVVGEASDATGTVWMTGGQLTVTNVPTVLPHSVILGDSGVGQMIVSNGTWLARDLRVAFKAGSQGTLTVAGGTNLIASLVVGESGGTGTFWLVGGQLTVTNSPTYLGDAGVGRMIVSNGTWLGQQLYVAYNGSATLTTAGGTSMISSNLTVGYGACAADGIVSVRGGALRVTNSDVTAVLDVQSGIVLHSGGILQINRLVITNSCGHFSQTGGTLSITTTNLADGLDADDDGLPNDWEQAHGLSPLDSRADNGATGDPDHDGFTNLEEFQAGTDPMDPGSSPSFHLTSIVKQGANVLLTWTTFANKTNVVQVTAGVAGSYSNNFIDLSPVIILPGIGPTSTNYLDVGGATNVPSRYYRVRLVP